MKIAGSYPSLLRGVSQQAAEVRQPGQHAEQVNMLSDPIAGLTRRRGSVLKAATDLARPLLSTDDAAGFRVHDHVVSSVDYSVLIREHGYKDTYNPATDVPSISVYNRTAGAFVPISTDAYTQDVVSHIGRFGLSAITSLGKYFVFALNGRTVGTATSTLWGDDVYSKLVVWVRGGAYTRTYKITLTDGRSAAYTTPNAGAAGAAEAISPQNIAQQLSNALGAMTPPVASAVYGAHLYVETNHTGTQFSNRDITCSDGGDNSLLRSCFATVDSVDKLPLMAWNGMIVKVITGPDSSFYVQAKTKTPTGSFAPYPHLSEAIWTECPGVQQVVSGGVGNFYIGTIYTDGKLYLANKPSYLAATLPSLGVPQFVPSASGDLVSNPTPSFLKVARQITYLGVFQDRLIVGSGSALAVSAAGDYFNFFRASVTTVSSSDAFEMSAMGGEDDVMRHGVAYNRNLVLFGNKRQYIISGQQALTPLSPNISVMTTYADAADVVPVSAGGLIYYARNREGNVGLHQIQPGAYVDSAESFPASAQIGDYIPAPAAQIEVVPGSPSLMLVRSLVAPRSVYVFSYLDQPDGRKQDAWSRWEFSASNGSLMGVQSTPEGVLLFWHRRSTLAGTSSQIVCDLLPLTPAAGDLPYFDSARPVTGAFSLPDPLLWDCAFTKDSDRYLIGSALSDYEALWAEYPSEADKLWAGIPFESYFIPTNPFVRDNNNFANLTGRTVITKYSVNMKDSGGFSSTITAGSFSRTITYNARVLGSILNLIGITPIETGIHTIPIGRETREFAVKIAALKWYPLQVVGIEWTGQAFNRTQRT